MPKRRVLIVGGGLAGLAAARAFDADRWEVHVLEPAKNGGGGVMGGEHHVSVWNNGWQAWDRLGVGKPLGTSIHAFVHRNGAERQLWRLDMSDLPGGPNRTRLVRLDDLREQLRTGLGHVVFKTGSFMSFAESANHVVVSWADRSPAVHHDRYDLLIGAAGKKCPVREQMFPGDPPIVHDHWLFEGVGEYPPGNMPEARDNHSREVGTIVVGYVGEGAWWQGARLPDKNEHRCFWVAGARLADVGPKAPLVAFLEQAKGLPPWILRVVQESTPVHAPERLMERRVATRWNQGRVGIMGDSAHGVALTLGQSVSLALEDAAILRAELNGDGAPTDALARWARRRAGRPEVMNLTSHSLAQTAISTAMPADLRDTLDGQILPLAANLVGRSLLNFPEHA